MAEDKKFLTQEGYERLVEERRNLKEEKLPDILDKIRDAVSQGDISENSEYDSAMSEKDLTEARINEIDEMLENVEIIEEGRGSEDIRYGSKVQIKDDKGEVYNFTIVGSGEVNILENTISFDSPLGTAIKGKKKGEKASIRAPKRRYEVEILDVK